MLRLVPHDGDHCPGELATPCGGPGRLRDAAGVIDAGQVHRPGPQRHGAQHQWTLGIWSIPDFVHTWFCVTQLRQVALL